MTTALNEKLQSLKARKDALVTKRERAQLERAILLLERVFARRCGALEIEPGYGDEDEDEIAKPADRARVYIDTLLEGDDDERARISLEASDLELKVWIESGHAFDQLEASLEKGRS